MLIAGEASGDVIGARLIAALRQRNDGRIRFSGIGGEAMAAQGLSSLFPIEELSVMGLFEVLPRAVGLLRRIREVAGTAIAERPDVVVSIDSPGFSLRVARRLRGQGIPLVHYVAPQVWAWRPGRAAKIAGLLDHLLTLFDFEPAYFEPHGLPCTVVGHPIVESGAGRGDGVDFRRRHEIAPDARILALLPGSRRGEVARLMPVYAETVRRLRQADPALVPVLLAAPAVRDTVGALAASWPTGPVLLPPASEKYDAFAAADVALAASGTVTLELALAGLPTVVAYRINPLTAVLARRLIRVNHASLVNILLQREVSPELLQEDCRPDRIADTLQELLAARAGGCGQRTVASEVAGRLAGDGPAPSLRAAEAVLKVIAQGPRKRF